MSARSRTKMLNKRLAQANGLPARPAELEAGTIQYTSEQALSRLKLLQRWCTSPGSVQGREGGSLDALLCINGTLAVLVCGNVVEVLASRCRQ